MTASEEYLAFRELLLERTGIDLQAYKDTQMQRRLNGYLKRVGCPDLASLGERISRDEQALQQLKDYLTINVSEFFRNPDRFETLASEVLPELGRSFPALRIWSAGCSIGAEAYSLAMLLEENRPGKGDHILATDIDATALGVAMQGIYTDDKLGQVSALRLERFFQPASGRQAWQVKDILRRKIRFKVHNLLSDEYPSDQHLILCRNVVIYFTEDAKEKVYQGFAESLAPGGYLLTGSSESIFSAGRYGLELVGPFLYRRVKRPLHGRQESVPAAASAASAENAVASLGEQAVASLR